MGNNIFSNQVWARIWNNCNYDCLFANNFLQMKQRVS